MSGKKAIIHSKQDPASLNIKEKIFNYLELEKKSTNYLKNDYFVNKDFLLYISDEKQLYLDEIDEKLKKIADIEHIIFPSRHSSEEGSSSFTVHAPGNPGFEAKYGGKALSLSKSAPSAMKKALHSLKEIGAKKCPSFDVSLECTHHGPSEINVPSLFIEIGDSREQWKNNRAGEVIAESIISLNKVRENRDAFISIGGSHYAPRQTRLLLDTEIAIGHIIPSYCLKNTNLTKITKEAIKKTPGAKWVHPTNPLSKEKRKEFEEDIDYTFFAEEVIRRLNPLPPRSWKKIIEIGEGRTPSYFGEKTKKLSLEVIEKELINYVEKVDKKKLINSIKELGLVFYQKNNGKILNHFLFPLNDLKEKRRRFIYDCIEIISEKRDIEVEEKNKGVLLDIIEKRFNPKKAKELGVSEKKFGVLANGNEIEISDNTITPAMVHNINKKNIEVRFCPTKKRIINV